MRSVHFQDNQARDIQDWFTFKTGSILLYTMWRQSLKLSCPKGKEYWCYNPTFNGLSAKLQAECLKHYGIAKSDFVKGKHEKPSQATKAGLHPLNGPLGRDIMAENEAGDEDDAESTEPETPARNTRAANSKTNSLNL